MSALHQVAAPRGRWSGLGQLLRGKLFRDSGIYPRGERYPRVLGVLLLPVLAHFLSPAEFGIISNDDGRAPPTFFGFGMLSMIPWFYFDFEPDRSSSGGSSPRTSRFSSPAPRLAQLPCWSGRGWTSVTSGSIPFVPYVLLALAIYLTGGVEIGGRGHARRAEVCRVEVVGLEMGVHLTAIAVGLYLVAFQEGGAAGKLAGEVVAGRGGGPWRRFC